MIKPTLALFGALSLAPAAAAQSFDYPDFSNWTGINPVGMTLQVGPVLQLQDNVAPPVGGDNRGAAWYGTPVSVVNGFDTTFEFRMHTPSTAGGSDGMAFLIHNDQLAGTPVTNGYPNAGGSTALGRHAAAQGWGVFTGSLPGESVDNSLAISLDTYTNGSWGDPNANHISIHTGGVGDNSQDESFSIGRATAGINMNNGAVNTLRISYVPGTLEVYLNGVLQLSVPYDFNSGGTWVDSGTPVGGLNLIGGSSAYVGFASGAGGALEFREVHSWSFASGGGPGVSFCSGDGSGSSCPCANTGGSGLGCANSSGAGALLVSGGTASALSDDLTFGASGLLPNQPALLFSGLNAVNGGAGTLFGDGLRCAGGNVVRLGVRVPDANGDANWGPGLGAVGGWTAGDVRRFQAWYRDPANSPCGTAFNLSNGLEVSFQ
jgi:hypothetical protein